MNKHLSPMYNRHKKSQLELASKGCAGCGQTKCRYFVSGLSELKLTVEPFGCHKRST